MALILWAELLLPPMGLGSSLPAAEPDSELEENSFSLRLPTIYIFKFPYRTGVFSRRLPLFFSSSIFTGMMTAVMN